MTNTWDAANRLVAATRGAYTLEPIYNGTGDRVAQTVGMTTTYFALDVQGLPEVIYTSDGDAYLHLPSVIVAESAAGERRYLLSDSLGSIRQAVDENGHVVAYHEFDPYGVPVQGGGDPYGYTGEWWEDEVELLHLRARWYFPETGTFLSKDPWLGNTLWGQSINGWAYVFGNPVNHIDTSGRWPDEMLDSKLGENWRSIYFFGDCDRSGIFAGRDNLYQFLISENTYDSFVLDFISEAFETARFMSLFGLSFNSDSPVDGIGVSIRGSASGTPFYGGIALEQILNTASGEVSVFIAGGGGASFGAKVGVTGGPLFLRNLPTNADYRNYFGSVSISGGAGIGLTAEGFWSAPKAPSLLDGPSGVFVGAGSVEGIAITGGYAFYYELFRVDAEGYQFLPDPFDYQPENIIPIIRDDILGTLQHYYFQLLN